MSMWSPSQTQSKKLPGSELPVTREFGQEPNLLFDSDNCAVRTLARSLRQCQYSDVVVLPELAGGCGNRGRGLLADLLRALKAVELALCIRCLNHTVRHQ